MQKRKSEKKMQNANEKKKQKTKEAKKYEQALREERSENSPTFVLQ